MTGDWALLHRANRPRTGVTVPTDAQGVATAPKLIAGPKLGSIEVTAYIGVSREVKAVFHPFVVKRRRH